MVMATVTRKRKLGPRDHGREMTYEEFMAAPYRLGYHYELIDGRLYVSPQASRPHDWVEKFIFRRLLAYSDVCPTVINEVSDKSRVFLPDVPRTTCPEPDVAAYRDYPHDLDPQVNWQDVSPILVVEVMGADDSAEKDQVRNVDLYLRVPSIREYWLVDIRDDPARPRMTAYRRFGARWRARAVTFGETYTTPLLPGFALVLDPRSKS
jgi:Uma2 family endonuclease